MRRIRKRIAAMRDVDRQAAHLGRASGNPELESRFLDAVEATFISIQELPTNGSPLALPRLAERMIRKWPVRGFAAILVIYCEMGDTIEVIRVLYGRQDWELLLKAPL